MAGRHRNASAIAAAADAVYVCIGFCIMPYIAPTGPGEFTLAVAGSEIAEQYQ